MNSMCKSIYYFILKVKIRIIFGFRVEIYVVLSYYNVAEYY